MTQQPLGMTWSDVGDDGMHGPHHGMAMMMDDDVMPSCMAIMGINYVEWGPLGGLVLIPSRHHTPFVAFLSPKTAFYV